MPRALWRRDFEDDGVRDEEGAPMVDATEGGWVCGGWVNRSVSGCMRVGVQACRRIGVRTSGLRLCGPREAGYRLQGGRGPRAA